MNIIGIIPARYKSTRFPGKPISDICGKPMIWWIYEQLKKTGSFKEIFVATDDERIAEACTQNDMNFLMTSEDHKTHIDRLYEVSEIKKADFYINVNGDEPLIKADAIKKIIPENQNPDEFYMANMMTSITNPVEVADTSKIKIAVDTFGFGMYMARYPIPFPKGNSQIVYNKFVGVQCFSKSALDFAHNTERGFIESCEDIDEYRFLENGKKIKFVHADVDNVSVDTPKDLQKVVSILQGR